MDEWRRIAGEQAGLITRDQLNKAGVRPQQVARRIRGERWQNLTNTVIGTTTGALTDEARLWLGVLHGGPGALLTGVHAAALHGLKNWQRDTILIALPFLARMTPELEGYHYIRMRRDIGPLRSSAVAIPCTRPAVAVLNFAARERNQRVRDGILAAAVQQRVVTVEDLQSTLASLGRIRWKVTMRAMLGEIAGGCSRSLSSTSLACAVLPGSRCRSGR